ncbi:hypothetical protein DPMN_160442 [Dreissena polymorpha]|uniref:Uncharacterized protein n=1 Tax=Dreissena polymorpha TaxID=45954 RepID=A0A9D4IQ47_DREPO|nr:hypothetical protein DPMN_160442 [Dreissena polymorpha]
MLKSKNNNGEIIVPRGLAFIQLCWFQYNLCAEVDELHEILKFEKCVALEKSPSVESTDPQKNVSRYVDAAFMVFTGRSLDRKLLDLRTRLLSSRTTRVTMLKTIAIVLVGSLAVNAQFGSSPGFGTGAQGFHGNMGFGTGVGQGMSTGFGQMSPNGLEQGNPFGMNNGFDQTNQGGLTQGSWETRHSRWIRTNWSRRPRARQLLGI